MIMPSIKIEIDWENDEKNDLYYDLTRAEIEKALNFYFAAKVDVYNVELIRD